MNISRRQALLKTLFGAGGASLALRSIATGLPVSFFANPRKAMADTCAVTSNKAQYVIFATSANGDPINAGAPGTVGTSGVYLNPQLTTTSITLAGKSYQAVSPWAALSQSTLDRTAFFHMATNTPIHPKEPEVLKLGDSSAEMLPSILAQTVYPTLKCIQAQPICLGGVAGTPAISFQGAPLPIISPKSLYPVLAGPSTYDPGQLNKLLSVRDKTMTDIYNIYYKSGNATQKAYITSLANTQTEARNLNQSLLGNLSTLATVTEPVRAQIIAAVTLIQLNIAPVFVINIPFGEDNHFDANLTLEATQTSGTSALGLSGVPAIKFLMDTLQTAGLQDKVTFASLNVFGRTLGANTTNGRNHNANHQVSVCIGSAFKGGVVGGCTFVKNVEAPSGDYGAMSIDPASGAGIPAGSGIELADTLAAFGKTVVTALGGCASSVLPSATSNTATVITGALT